MCGIVGFNWPDAKLINRAMSALAHRGPDAFDAHVDTFASLGHRRLSIIDLSESAKQPMSDSTQRYWIVFNGEIYNYLDLRKQLEKKGRRFRTSSDTEVIIYGYIEWGSSVVKKLNGMFAFCIYDSKEKTFFCARDHFGIKPFYYYWDGQRFIFASELKGILTCAQPTLNTNALNDYLTLGYVLAPHTIFNQVFQLLPGHTLHVRAKTLRSTPYFTLNLTEEHHPEHHYIKLIQQKLTQSVQRQLVADVPVGAFLSGGIDSSAVVATMRNRVEDLKTFSISFGHAEFDESKHSALVSKQLNTEHYDIPFTEQDVLKSIPLLAKHYDEPFADPSMLPTYLVSTVARKHVTVSLSGDGGDETFGGYQRYLWFKMLRWHRHTPPVITSTVFKPLVKLAAKTTGSHLFTKGHLFLENAQQSEAELYARSMVYTTDAFRNQLGVDSSGTFAHFQNAFATTRGYNRMIAADFAIYLPNDILVKLDRATMAASLEGRVPLLDPTLVDIAARMPFSYKLNGFTTKYLFKKALRDRLPKEILTRKKQGFGIPLKHYFRSDLGSYFADCVLAQDSYISQHYPRAPITKLFDSHKKHDASYALFALLMLEEWFDTWYNK